MAPEDKSLALAKKKTWEGDKSAVDMKMKSELIFGDGEWKKCNESTASAFVHMSLFSQHLTFTSLYSPSICMDSEFFSYSSAADPIVSPHTQPF